MTLIFRSLFVFFAGLASFNVGADTEIKNKINIQEVVSPKGIKAWLVEDHTIPVIAFDFSFKAGNFSAEKHKEGVPALLASLLTEGAGPYDHEAFGAILQDYAIGLSFSDDLDFFSGSLKTTTLHKDKAFELLTLSLNKPRFEQKSFIKNKKAQLAQLVNSEKSPDYIASLAFHTMIFGETYGHPFDGNSQDLKHITLNDIKSFKNKNLCLDTLTVGVCGDITPTELKSVLDNIFGEIQKACPKTTVGKVSEDLTGGLKVIKTHHPQSVVSFGQKGLKVSDPNFRKIQLIMNVLGGGFRSRLLNEIRVKRGLVYALGVGPKQNEHAALVVGKMASDNARVKEALDILKKEWAKLRDNGITKEELEENKLNLIGGYPLNFGSSTSIANLLKLYQEWDLGIDFINTRNEKIRALRLEDVNQFAKTFLKPDELTIVVVGAPQDLHSSK